MTENKEQKIDELLASALEKVQAEDWQGAIADYDEVIKLDESISVAWNGRGVGKNTLNLFEEAIKDFDEAIKLDPNNLTSWTARGAAKYKLGKVDEAVADLTRALELKPNDPNILKILEAVKAERN